MDGALGKASRLLLLVFCAAWVSACAEAEGPAFWDEPSIVDEDASQTSPPEALGGPTQPAEMSEEIDASSEAGEEDVEAPALPPFIPSADDFLISTDTEELRRMLPNDVVFSASLSPEAASRWGEDDRLVWTIEGEGYESAEVGVRSMGARDLIAELRWLRGEEQVAWRGIVVPTRPIGSLTMPPSPAQIPPPPLLLPGGGRVAVISDSNGSYGSVSQPGAVDSAVDALIDQGVDLVIHCGDMVAGQSGGLSRGEVDAMWGGYHSTITDRLTASGATLVPVAGNHDADPSMTHDRPAYIEQWTSRRPDVEFIDDERYPMAYSFAYQGSFFLVIDGATGNLGSDREIWGDVSQLQWVEAQLLAAQDYQYRFAFSHVPFSSFTQEENGDIMEHGSITQGDALFDVFTRMNLDVFFSAHYHVFFKGRYAGSPSSSGGDALNVVSTGRIGSGARYPIGQSERQSRAFVLMDLEDGLMRDLFGLERTDDGVYSRVFQDAWLSLYAGDYVRFDVE